MVNSVLGYNFSIIDQQKLLSCYLLVAKIDDNLKKLNAVTLRVIRIHNSVLKEVSRLRVVV
jgi:hypothetical protein